MFQPIALKRIQGNPDAFIDTFKQQFLLSRDADLELPGWITHSAEGWYLRHAPDLPYVMLSDERGQQVGILLGRAVDAQGQALQRERKLDLVSGSEDFLDRFEKFIEGCAGRYVVVLMAPDAQRLYLDPVGDLAAVYDAENARAGSTNVIVQARDFIDNPIMPFGRVRTGELAYTMGHTRDADVKRLLASHFLDLARMVPVRHWPRPDLDLETRHDPSDVLAINDEITARLSQITCEFLRTEKVILPLSGGRDSRCLLGAGIEEMRRAEFLFTWRFHRQSGKDSERAKEICSMLDLPHQEFKFQRLTRPMRMEYLLRNGYAILGTALQSLAISESIPGGHVMLRGNIMGILRATNWQRQREGVLNLAHALKRLRSGFSSEERMEHLGGEFMAYFDAMPRNAQNKIYDIAWTDIVLTHGQGARSYGTVQNFILNPFNDRRLLQLSMQLPVRYRFSDAAYDRIVETTLPQLEGVPYV